MIPVKDKKNLFRDPYSKAIINTDLDALAKHKKKQEQIARSNYRISSMENRINTIEKTQQEILNLLKKLTNDA